MPILKTRSHGYDLESAFEWLRGKARTTIRLHPRIETCLPANASKVGGEILWPANEPWPHCQKHHSDHVAVLQIHSDDVPGTVFPACKDLLHILWCPNDHEECGYGPALTVFWREARSLLPFPLSKLQVNTGNKDYIPRQCRLSPEAVQEYPSAGFLSQSQFGELEQWQEGGAELYQYSLSVAPGFKVGGYPHWSQDPEVPTCSCGKKMDYLLTIDSAEFDGGTYERWLPEAEERVWSAPYEVRNLVQCGAGLMLGDMGQINVFVCRACDPWEHRWIFQCS